MSEPKKRFALIGCGRIAHRHAGHIQRLGELVAACDPHLESAEKLCAEYGGKPYSSLDEMLKDSGDFEIASVCSPNALHAEHSIAALGAGLHVLCEKPMAIRTRDCEDMIQAAERANRRLFIVKQNRFNPPVQAVKQLIEEGRLGKIYSLHVSCFWNRNEQYYSDSWKGTRELDGGTLFTLFSHFVDLLYWFVGDVEQVHAITGNLGHEGMIEIEDTGAIVLEFRDGAIGTINYTVNSYGGNMEGSVTIFGEKGTVKIGGQYLNELEYCRIEGEDDAPGSTGHGAGDYIKYEGSQSRLDKVYENMIETLADRSPIATSGFEGMKTVEIIEKVYRASGF